MAIELGALLGELKGSQSFETLGSWDTTSINTAIFSVSNNNSGFQHSSDLSGFISVVSGNSGMVSYDYGVDNDTYNRWWFRTGSHSLVSYFWTKNASDTQTESGQLVTYLNSESLPITITSIGTRRRLDPDGSVTGWRTTSIGLSVETASGGPLSIYGSAVNAVRSRALRASTN